MAHTTVSDFVIWTKHIHGDPAIERAILALEEGEAIRLRVAGAAGAWTRMKDGKDGRPTPGIRPIGAAKDFWRELYSSRRGDVVDIEVISEDAGLGAPRETRLIDRSPESRLAAIEAFLGLSGQGWRSEGRSVSRDEMHER
ncbi:hypothetical protein [Brevundimonas sp.]|uniref:hypothetical protein n=1 Tax=Brevundimonas sp. TaxID=1871086 RepID=UPI001D784AF9|nr:hypothetical protein [Brevundimonas sp.]MBL0947256.1 hypothetical protein [Brevundimonas sp.]